MKKTTKPKNANILPPLYVSSLSLSILAKFTKEINKISKYFKKQQLTNYGQKSYAQILAKQSNSANIARKILKIKETFSNLQNKKIGII